MFSQVCNDWCNHLHFNWLANNVSSWFGLDNWTEEAWIRPRLSSGNNRMEFIFVALAAVATIVLLSKVLGCGVIVNTLLYGFALLEESMAFMRSTKDQREMAPKATLVRHANDFFLHAQFRQVILKVWWHRPLSQLYNTCHIRYSIGIGTSYFMTSAKRGDHFGGIVWKRRDKINDRIGGWVHSVYLCGWQPSAFPPLDVIVSTTTVICSVLHVFCDLIFISEADLQRLGPADQMIVRWLC